MKHDTIIKIQLESNTELPVVVTVNKDPQQLIVSGTMLHEITISARTDYVITIEQEHNDLDSTFAFTKLVFGKFDITGMLTQANFDNSSSCYTISKATGKPVGRLVESIGKDEKVILNIPNEFPKYVVDKIHLIKDFGE